MKFVHIKKDGYTLIEPAKCQVCGVTVKSIKYYNIAIDLTHV